MKWEKQKLKDVCELAYGKSLTADSRIPGNYPVYGSAGEVGTHTNYLIDGPGIIIGRKGSVGTVYYEKRNFFPIDTSYYVIPKDGNDLRFLYYKFQTLGLNKLNSDAAVPGLNRNVAYEQSSIYPPLPTQRRIASILSAYDDLIENNLKRIRLLEEKAFLRYKQIVREEK
jgi:type I restriction enzyme S subunit